jgi:L-ribulose-5-phosphate 4-epimerase
MSEINKECSDWAASNARNTVVLRYWTLAWVVSTAVAAFGPKLAWNFHTALTIIVVLINLGIGFGNISVRASASGRFIISGTQTGHLAEVGGEHFALVTEFDLATNNVTCNGPIQASSESMTHATIYSLDASINAVVHIHSAEMWVRLSNVLPATDAEVAYGTPEMAKEFERLYGNTEFPATGVAIMAGHEDGLISIGGNLQEAASRVLELAGD